MNEQLEMFAPGYPQQFEVWKATPGGRRVLQMAYAIAARYARRHARTGRRVSVRLIWEMLRDNVGFVRRSLRQRQALAAWEGFVLNDHFHAYVARHMVARRPEWRGLFEMREVGKKRTKRKVIVIEERLAA